MTLDREAAQGLEEAKEAAAWALSEMDKLLVEVERMRKVHDLARSVVVGSDESGDPDAASRVVSTASLTALREAIFASEVAVWKASEPALLSDVPEWLARRPVQGHETTGSRPIRSWLEDGGACVTDGHALLFMPRAVVADRNPCGGGTASRVLKCVDWYTSVWVLYEDMIAVRDLASQLGERMMFGVSEVDPLLIEHFVPRCPGVRLHVSTGDDWCNPLGIRACLNGEEIFRSVIMPMRVQTRSETAIPVVFTPWEDP